MEMPLSTAPSKEESFEISPTMPFVPAAAGSAGAAEVSPTMPFVPAYAAPAHRGAEVEVSPTMPYVPAAAAPALSEVQISPTMPFVPAAAAPAGANVEISPTMPFAPAAATLSGAGASSTYVEAAAKTPEERKQEHRGDTAAAPAEPAHTTPGKLKRPIASMQAEDSPSEGEDLLDEPRAGVAQDDDVLERDETDARLKQQERDWLRQKRRKLREEESHRRQQEAKGMKEQRRVDVMQRLGTSSMSKEDASRYEDVVADGAVAFKPKAGIGLRALAGEEDDEAALFGGFRKGAAARRPSILLGGGSAKAS